MWSNEMAGSSAENYDQTVRYGSPTNWMASAFDDYSSDDDESLTTETCSDTDGFNIEFTADNVAEAMDYGTCLEDTAQLVCSEFSWYNDAELDKEHTQYYEELIKANMKKIQNKGIVIKKEDEFKKVSSKEVVSNDREEGSGLNLPPVAKYIPKHQEALYKVIKPFYLYLRILLLYCAITFLLFFLG